MLYVSTRNRTDSYTAHRALHEQHAPDSGYFVPFQLPRLEQDQISQLNVNSFCVNVANILNLFFSERLTGWDVEFAIGRYPVEIIACPRKLTLVELWHNLSASYSRTELALYNRLCGNTNPISVPPWAKIAIMIAMLFATYALTDACKELEPIDVAVDSHDFILPMATWIARKMGLPLETIVCGTYDNSALWDLLHRGEVNTPMMTRHLHGVEQLIYMTLGQSEAENFVNAVIHRRTYFVPEESLPAVQNGLYSAVISRDRVNPVISSFYRSNHYLLDQVAAVSYGALQDYRSSTGESRKTLILSLESPTRNADLLCGTLGLSAAEIDEIANHRKR